MKDTISSDSKATKLERWSGVRGIDTDIRQIMQAFIHAGLCLKSFESKTLKTEHMRRKLRNGGNVNKSKTK